jgi:hypothetical protein
MPLIAPCHNYQLGHGPVSFALANEMRQFVMAITHPEPLTVPSCTNPHDSN